MVDVYTFKATESYGEFVVYQRNLRKLFYALRTVDELNRLLEIRVEELETSFQLKDRPDVIDDRKISALIGDKWVESI